MKKVFFLTTLLLLSIGYSHAQCFYPLDNGDTLWFEGINDDGDKYAKIVAPGGQYYGWQWHSKPNGNIVFPDSLPEPWYWDYTRDWYFICDTTSEEIVQDWLNNAPRIPVRNIGSNAFSECNGITNVVIPPTVQSIFPGAFNKCTGITTITIGESVLNIGSATFKNCTNLTTITCKAEMPPVCQDNTFEGVPRYADIIVPCGAAYRYELSDFWNEFPRITEDCDGIDDIETLSDIRINVINGSIVVDGEKDSSFDVYDITGRTVATVRQGFSTQTLPNGIYMVRIGTAPAQKIVVVR